MEILENLLKCGVCEEVFNKPTILGCGHTFCSTCLSDCEFCPQCESNQSRWRRKSRSKITVSTKWHAGDDIALCFRHNRKDEDKINAALKSNMKCPICCGFFQKATVTVCGHVYCKRCLDSWMVRHQHCPVCRSECQAFPWPLGDKLAEETRRTFKRTRTDDSDLEEEIRRYCDAKRRKMSQTGRRRRSVGLTVISASSVVVGVITLFRLLYG